MRCIIAPANCTPMLSKRILLRNTLRRLPMTVKASQKSASSIRSAAVIGSGVMGAGIAAHLANAGMRVLLLDIVPQSVTAEEERQGLTLADANVRSRLASAAVARMSK